MFVIARAKLEAIFVDDEKIMKRTTSKLDRLTAKQMGEITRAVEKRTDIPFIKAKQVGGVKGVQEQKKKKAG